MREWVVVPISIILIFTCLALVMVPQAVESTILDVLLFSSILVKALVLLFIVAALVFIALGVWTGIERMRQSQAGREKLQREFYTAPAGSGAWLRESNGQIINLGLDPRIHVTGNGPTATPEEMQAWLWYHSMHATRHAQIGTAEAKLLNAPAPVDLLSHMQGVRRALIVGNPDAGKTTLLKHVIVQRLPLSQVIVIDPHSGPDTWPCEVIGRGSDHRAIEKALDGFLALMIRRYREIGAGDVPEGKHRRITLIIDEWLSIVGECQNASRVIIRLISEARKAGLDVFVGSQSERVRSLGLDGRGDLREGLEIIKLNYSQWSGERSATIQIGDEVVPAILPGEFDNGVWRVEKPERVMLPEVEPSEEEQRIIDMHEAGESVSTIAEAIYGYKGGNQNRRVQEVIDKWCKV